MRKNTEEKTLECKGFLLFTRFCRLCRDVRTSSAKFLLAKKQCPPTFSPFGCMSQSNHWKKFDFFKQAPFVVFLNKCHVCLPMSTNPSFQRMEVLSSGSVPSLEWMPGSDPNGLFSATSDNQKIDQKLHKPVPTSHLKVHFCINVSFNRDVNKIVLSLSQFSKDTSYLFDF